MNERSYIICIKLFTKHSFSIKGAILPGFDADFVIWDPNEKFTVQAEDILCRNKDTSPYIGKEFKGVVKRYVSSMIVLYSSKYSYIYLYLENNSKPL